MALESKFVAIDTETNGKDVRDGRGKMLGVSLAYRMGTGEIEALYLPFFHFGGNNYDFNRFFSVIQTIINTKPCIFHNAEFDLVSLSTRGFDVENCNFYCTMQLAHHISEENPYSKSLDSCAKFYLDGDSKKNKEGTLFARVLKAVGWEMMPALIMAEYAAYDADLPLRLFEKIWPKVVIEGTQANWYHKREFMKLMIKVEASGVRIDTRLCEEMALTGHREMGRLLSELKGLNPMSINDLPILLIDQLGLPEIKVKRPNGTYTRSFDKKTMEIYEEILSRNNDTTAQRVLSYRGWQKSVSSNYESYLKFLSPDGRLRPNYLLHRTKTGRLSCKEPNLQQIPKEGTKPWNGRMKKCFVPRDGYVLVEGDYSQLEFRLAASYAGEKCLLDIFNDSNRDIFTEMSLQLKMDRQDCKTRVYSMQYGAGPNRISLVSGITKQEAAKWIDDFYTEYPNLKKASKIVEYATLETGRAMLWSGRYRHFNQPRYEAYKAFNSVIQGGAADIVERTMLRCAANGLDSDECRMLLQIHDSIVFEVREDLLPLYKPQIKYQMEAVEPDFGVRFKVDLHMFGEK